MTPETEKRATLNIFLEEYAVLLNAVAELRKVFSPAVLMVLGPHVVEKVQEFDRAAVRHARVMAELGNVREKVQ